MQCRPRQSGRDRKLKTEAEWTAVNPLKTNQASAQATQVSERTLRAIFHEYFGADAIRLLKARQLRNIHAGLLRADPKLDTVTPVAAQHGIWDLAQFARNYKALFGESPSRTLRTPPSERCQRSTLSWLHYALRVFSEPSQARCRP
jgi:AraC family transcriptional regulator, ethanolamine operon transcriptional activator